MNNKKVVFLTVILIFVLISGIGKMAVFIETLWQTTESKGNTLTVNENNLQSYEIMFDYPYTCIGNSDLIFNDNMISFQDAANIGGEIIKYIYGVSQQSVDSCQLEVAIAAYQKFYKTDFAYNYYFSDSNNVKYFMQIDAYSGELFYLQASDVSYLKRFDKVSEISDDEQNDLLDIIGQYMDLMRIDKEITDFECIKNISDEGVTAHYLDITFDDGLLGTVNLYTAGDNYYFLSSFVIRNTISQ